MSVIVDQPNSAGPPYIPQPTGYEDVYSATQPPDTIIGFESLSIPSSLLALAYTEYLVIKQKKEWLEIACGCETKNKYEIYDQQNQLIYTAQENSDICMRHLCGRKRPLVVDIRDKNGNTAVVLDRAFLCNSERMSIYSPPGQLIGFVEQPVGQCGAEVYIKNEQNGLVFIVKCPVLRAMCNCGDTSFPIFTSDGVTECGRICKGRGDFLQIFASDADIFCVQFPPASNPYFKTLILGATFLIDYIYFERTN